MHQGYMQQYRGKTQSTESLVNKISGRLHKHAQQQLNGIECMQELTNSMHVGVPSLLDSVIMFCHMCNSMCVYASVLFKNGKGSFTQCILVHMHKGV